MRIETAAAIDVPLYCRGLALDYFDGISWKNSSKDRERILPSDGIFVIVPFDLNDSIEQKVFLEPIDSDVIFGLEEMAGLRVNSYSLMVDDEMNVFMRRRTPRRIAYTVYSGRQGVLPGVADGKFLQLPGKGIERIRHYAKKITSDAKMENGKADSIERYLKHNYTYSLSTSAPPRGVSPVEDFLFNTKK